jgi:cytoskeletal protein CcmA (bactofilin family)
LHKDGHAYVYPIQAICSIIHYKTLMPEDIVKPTTTLDQADTQVVSPTVPPIQSADAVTTIASPAQSQTIISELPTAAQTARNEPTLQKPSVTNRILHGTNIYMLIFLIILAVVLAGIYLVYRSTQKESSETISSGNQTSLTPEQLQQLRETDTQIGTEKQTLTIDSNAVFNGGVLAKGSLDVAGDLNVGGAINLPGLTVSGTSTFDTMQIGNDLGVGGDSTITGQLSVRRGLTVSGSGSFGGNLTAAQLNVEQLQLSQNLTLNRHLVTGGGTPKISVAGAGGAGSTASINGTDTAGTININTGSSPGTGSGANITFSASFGSAPHVSLTPGSAAAAITDYYVTRATTGFSIQFATPPPAGSVVSFEYVVIN